MDIIVGAFSRWSFPSGYHYSTIARLRNSLAIIPAGAFPRLWTVGRRSAVVEEGTIVTAASPARQKRSAVCELKSQAVSAQRAPSISIHEFVASEFKLLRAGKKCVSKIFK